MSIRTVARGTRRRRVDVTTPASGALHSREGSSKAPRLIGQAQARREGGRARARHGHGHGLGLGRYFRAR